MNDSRATGRLRLRHLQEVTEAKAEEMANERPRFERLAGDRSRVVVAFNLFQTPAPLASRLVNIARQGRDLGRVLEPSAGLGRIYQAIRFVSDARVDLVEIAPQCAAELYAAIANDDAATLHQRDFLTHRGEYDTVIMNPPFKNGTDIKHIEHARTLLAPGGRLVSLCYAGTRQRAAYGDRWEMLPAGSFRSEGTNADAAIVVFNKGTP